MLSLLFLVMGVLAIYWRAAIAVSITASQLLPLRWLFGDDINSVEPAALKFLKVAVLFAGISLLIAAAAAYFGPLDFSCGGHLCPRPAGYPL